MLIYTLLSLALGGDANFCNNLCTGTSKSLLGSCKYDVPAACITMCTRSNDFTGWQREYNQFCNTPGYAKEKGFCANTDEDLDSSSSSSMTEADCQDLCKRRGSACAAYTIEVYREVVDGTNSDYTSCTLHSGHGIKGDGTDGFSDDYGYSESYSCGIKGAPDASTARSVPTGLEKRARTVDRLLEILGGKTRSARGASGWNWDAMDSKWGYDWDYSWPSESKLPITLVPELKSAVLACEDDLQTEEEESDYKVGPRGGDICGQGSYGHGWERITTVDGCRAAAEAQGKSFVRSSGFQMKSKGCFESTRGGKWATGAAGEFFYFNKFGGSYSITNAAYAPVCSRVQETVNAYDRRRIDRGQAFDCFVACIPGEMGDHDVHMFDDNYVPMTDLDKMKCLEENCVQYCAAMGTVFADAYTAAHQ